MTLDELNEKHAKEWEGYEKSREKAERELNERQHELRDAFFDNEIDMPLSIKERTRMDNETHLEAWGIFGTKSIELRAAQNKERDKWYKVEEFKEQLNKQKENEEKNRNNNEYEWS